MKREDAYMLVACLVVFIVIPAILWVTVIAPQQARLDAAPAPSSGSYTTEPPHPSYSPDHCIILDDGAVWCEGT